MTIAALLLVLAVVVALLRHTRPPAYYPWPAAHEVEDRDADRLRLDLRARS